MADNSIMADVLAASDELEGIEKPPIDTGASGAQETGSETAVTETAQQTADRARDESGRFARESKDRKTLTLPKEKPLAAAPAATPVSPVLGEPAAPIDPTKPVAEKIAPPQEWGGLAKVKWDRLPVDVQKEIAAHEATRQQATADLAPVSELLGVNREFLVNQAGSVPEAMRQMMQFARMSVDNPVQLAEHILRARGIDPRAAFAGQPQAQQQGQAPDLQSYVAQLVQQGLQPLMAQHEQQQTQQLQTTISQFAADPKRPFFNDVRVQMGQLIQAGAAKSLEDAYDQATWANPAIRSHLMQEQTEATQRQKAAEAQRATLATRASVRGSPLTGAALNGKGDPKANALDDVRAAFAELSGQ